MDSAAIDSPHSSPSPQPQPPKFARAPSPTSVASSTSSRKRSYDEMSDADEVDCVPERAPIRRRTGFWGRAVDGLSWIFSFVSLGRPTSTTAAPDDGDDDQSAESEYKTATGDEAAVKDGAVTEGKEGVLEGQAKHKDTIETATQRATGGNDSGAASQVNTERLKIGIPGPDEISIKKLPAHHQLPSPLASEDETPVRKVVAHTPLLSKKLTQMSRVEHDGVTTFLFGQAEKPFNPKRRPRKNASQIYESALIRREEAEDIKTTIRGNRQQAFQTGTPGRSQIRKPTMGIPLSTPHSTPRRPSDRLGSRVKKPEKKKEARTIRAIERARDAGSAIEEILGATIGKLQTETNGFQTLDAARVRQQEIDAEVERIRAEEEQKRAEAELARIEEKRRAQREVIRPLRGKELEEVGKLVVRIRADALAKKEVVYKQVCFMDPREFIGITTTALWRVVSNNFQGWLNDDAINHYCRLVFEREKPRVMTFTHWFFNSLREPNGYLRVQNFATKRGCGGMKLLECSLIIFPMIENNNHWTLAAINPPAKRFEYYDSMRRRHGVNAPFNVLRYYLHNETRGQVNLDEWENYEMPDYPQQANTNDCGVFVLKTMEVISRGGIPNYPSQDIHHARVRILWELRNLELLPLDYGKAEDDAKKKKVGQ